MSDLSQQNNESAVIAENTDVSLNWGAGNNARGRIVTDCRNKSIRFSPAFIFARLARSPPALT